MSKLTPIKPGLIAKNQPDPAVIALLEKYLAWAKEGQVVSVALALDTGSAITTDWEGSRDSMQILGGVALLQTRLANAIDAYSRSL